MMFDISIFVLDEADGRNRKVADNAPQRRVLPQPWQQTYSESQYRNQRQERSFLETNGGCL